MQKTVAAHSCNQAGVRHDLITHLRSVAQLAADFTDPFGGRLIGSYAGLSHDIGKCPEPFQQYLRYCEPHPGERRRGPDHKGAGSLLAKDYISIAAMTIQGHHGGLRSAQDFRAFLQSAANDPNVERAIAWATATIPELCPRFVLSSRRSPTGIGSPASSSGSVLTTRHLLYEQDVKEALGLPENAETFAILPIGWPIGKFGPVSREPVEKVTFLNKWGQPLPG